jgi:hypothetical protein
MSNKLEAVMRIKDRGIRALHRIMRIVAAEDKNMTKAEREWLVARLSRVECSPWRRP